MSTDTSDVVKAHGLATQGTKKGLDLILAELTPAQTVRIWNAYLVAETVKPTVVGQKRMVSSFINFRRAFREALNRSPNKEKVSVTVTGELALVGEDPAPVPSMVEPVEAAPLPAAVSPTSTAAGKAFEDMTTTEKLMAMYQPGQKVSKIDLHGSLPVGPLKLATSNTPPPPAVPATRVLTPLEQKMMLSSAKSGTTVQVDPRVHLDGTVHAELLAAVDEAQRERQKMQDHIQWSCTKAEELLAAHQTHEGEALWTASARLEKDPTTGQYTLFILSSTAPLILQPGVASPVIKHDYRANDQPVTHAHQNAFRQLDGHKIIRSKVFKQGFREYYVKALYASPGMILKGYFVVDGAEDETLIPPRYLQIASNTMGMVLVEITASAYQHNLARLAAGRAPEYVPPPRGGNDPRGV